CQPHFRALVFENKRDTSQPREQSASENKPPVALVQQAWHAAPEFFPNAQSKAQIIGECLAFTEKIQTPAAGNNLDRVIITRKLAPGKDFATHRFVDQSGQSSMEIAHRTTRSCRLKRWIEQSDVQFTVNARSGLCLLSHTKQQNASANPCGS